MNNNEFNEKKRKLNEKYYDIFNTIPCMQDYLCTREEYINALEKSINDKIKIDDLLTKVGKPLDKNSLI